jgi:Amidases related to nicotinamidase
MTVFHTPAQSALVIIDTQAGIVDAQRSHHTSALTNIRTLLERARNSGTPIIYIQHNGPAGDDLEPGLASWQIHPAIAPLAGESIVNKTAPDSFYKTSLQTELQRLNVHHLIVAGEQTECCVDTTVRRATTFGYNVTLVSDAHFTFDTDTLSENQIVAFYNETLNGFHSGDATIQVIATEKILFPAYVQ